MSQIAQDQARRNALYKESGTIIAPYTPGDEAMLRLIYASLLNLHNKVESIFQMQEMLMGKLTGIPPIADETIAPADRPASKPSLDDARLHLEVHSSVDVCSACNKLYKTELLKTTKTGKWCSECYVKRFPQAAKRGKK